MQVAALPVRVRVDFAQIVDVLGVAPWNGEPQNADNPDGAVRHWLLPDGGQVVYLVLERAREVHVVLVQWTR